MRKDTVVSDGKYCYEFFESIQDWVEFPPRVHEPPLSHECDT